MDTFFTDAFESFSNKEEFYKAVFMNTAGEEAEKLRAEYFRGVMAHVGKHVEFGKKINIVNPQWISLGDNVCISDGVTIIARGPGPGPDGVSVKIGDNVTLCDRVYLDTESGNTGYITIGNNVYIGTGTTLFGHEGLEIGEHSLLAQNISLTPYSHIFEDPDRPIIAQGGHCRKVTIGRDVYIGMNSTILYSADIGEGSVVGSATVVVKPLPPYSVAVGNPARIIRKRGEAKK